MCWILGQCQALLIIFSFQELVFEILTLKDLLVGELGLHMCLAGPDVGFCSLYRQRARVTIQTGQSPFSLFSRLSS